MGGGNVKALAIKRTLTARGTIRQDAGAIFDDVLSVVAPKERTNATPIARQAGKVLLACDHCGLQFWRKSSHAGARNYCGQGCSSAAQIKRVSCSCSICKQTFLIWPNAAKKGRATCGKPECIHARQKFVAKERVRDSRRVFSGPSA
jgi:hypothetical protein